MKNIGVSVLELSKSVMYEFPYNYVQSKHGEKTKVCYMDTEKFVVYIKKDEIYLVIVEDVERRTEVQTKN